MKTVVTKDGKLCTQFKDLKEFREYAHSIIPPPKNTISMRELLESAVERVKELDEEELKNKNMKKYLKGILFLERGKRLVVLFQKEIGQAVYYSSDKFEVRKPFKKLTKGKPNPIEIIINTKIYKDGEEVEFELINGYAVIKESQK